MIVENFRLQLFKRGDKKPREVSSYKMIIRRASPNESYRYMVEVFDEDGVNLNRKYYTEAKADTIFGCKMVARGIVKKHKKYLKSGEVVKTTYI